MKIKKTNSGQTLWNKAKKLIPGGNMLLSKRPEMYAPNQWPTYYNKAKNCFVWDIDNNKYNTQNKSSKSIRSSEYKKIAYP